MKLAALAVFVIFLSGRDRPSPPQNRMVPSMITGAYATNAEVQIAALYNLSVSQCGENYPHYLDTCVPVQFEANYHWYVVCPLDGCDSRMGAPGVPGLAGPPGTPYLLPMPFADPVGVH